MAYDNDLIAGKLRRWEKYLERYRLPAWEEIPDFGLYMEQVVQLLKQYLDYMPPELMDYVIVHELAHRRHMDHSALFWEEVARYCPEYAVYRNQLKKYETV